MEEQDLIKSILMESYFKMPSAEIRELNEDELWQLILSNKDGQGYRPHGRFIFHQGPFVLAIANDGGEVHIVQYPTRTEALKWLGGGDA